MTIINIPYAADQIEVSISNPLKQKALVELQQKLSTLITTFVQDLHHRHLASEINTFNAAPVPSSVQVSPHAWDFMVANIQSSAASSGNLSTFKLAGDKLPFEHLDAALKVEKESQVIHKIIPVELDSSPLLTSYILDQLAAQLQYDYPKLQFQIGYLDHHISNYAYAADVIHPMSLQSLHVSVPAGALLQEVAINTGKSELSPVGVIIHTTSLIRAKTIAADLLARPVAELMQLAAPDYIGYLLLEDGRIWFIS